MRKIVIVLISLLMIPIQPLFALSADSEEACEEAFFSGNEYVQMLNQYEEYEKLAKTKSLIKADWKCLTELKNAISSYPEYIVSLQSYSDEELRKYNFNDGQIYAIRHYDGSEEMTKAASASVSGSLSKQYSYNGSTNKTTVTVTFTATWSGVPFIRADDTAAVGITGSTANFNKSSVSGKITKQNGTTVNLTNGEYTSMKGYKYKFGIPDGDGVIKKVTIVYKGVAQGKVTVYDYGGCYAHRTVSIGAPSFGISISSTGPSFGLSFTVLTGHQNLYNNIDCVN